ncbi:MAG: M20/M25/M40 family metallo-hydrolase [Actinomycetia bacterium]|nr:M20/M25/M40 family metallo-hydrolase [Actinomycetes bacterium]MCP4085858.1 M20/M25/M40 family metallo-hydrolase [Actinomycetes bacterium]
MDSTTVTSVVDQLWADAVPVLEDYIRIPAKSPAFDPDWEAHGHLADAIELVRSWCVANAPANTSVEVLELAGRTPVILIEVGTHGGSDDDTVLVYGHIDKQPEMTGWNEGLGPWTPVIDNDRLYGRGGADDGYSAFAVIAALRAVQEAGGRHNRCLALIEASEESGSIDLPAHLEVLGDRLGQVSLVIALDSGAGDYDSLWVTTSLRGGVHAVLRVEVLTEGVHSGMSSGAVPSSFRIMRQLLDRIEDPVTGRVLLPELHVDIPADRMAEARSAAEEGLDIGPEFPWAGDTRPMSDDPAELLLATTWRPTLSYVGANGVPSIADGGNVLRPYTELGLSFRLPPLCDPSRAAAAIKEKLEADPPDGANVTCEIEGSGSGWNAAPNEMWLADVLATSSTTHFGRPTRSFGIGGGIPFMAMLGQRYPAAQFVVTGVLGPESNAHGPNEFLDIPTGRKVTACVAEILDAHAAR